MASSSQEVEAFVGVQPASTVGTLLRVFNFVVAQPDGSFKTVSVEPTIVLDPDTGKTLVPMSCDQADAMVRLLEKLVQQNELLLRVMGSST